MESGARLEGPLFIDAGCHVKAGARIGPYTVLGEDCRVDEEANVSGAIVWPHTHIAPEAEVRDAIIGRGCRIGGNATVAGGVLGDRTDIAEHSRL